MKSPHKCADCPIRRRAEAKPESLLAKIWRWHTTWCPGWRAYQRALKEQEKVVAG
jgi:hypothetical protein